MAQPPEAPETEGQGQAARPYPPSWVDRLTGWVDRLPGPAWLYYGAGALLTYLAYLAAKWWDGSLPGGTLPRFPAVIVGSMFYYVALIDHLDKVAKRAMASFRPAAHASDDRLAALEFRLTTMPARPVWVATAAGLVYGSLVLVAAWQGLMYVPASPFTSAPATLLEVAVVLGLSINLLVFVFHTFHQLRMVNRIYTHYTKVDLFNLDPLHAFSRLAAHTAVGAILLQILWQTGESWMAADAATLATGAGIVVLALVTFFWPLHGLNRLLVEEKERLKAIAGQRLKKAVHDLNRALDADELDKLDPLTKGLQGANLEMQIVEDIPTWPWQPGALRSVAGAVLLPLFLWLLTRLLEQVFTF